MVGDENDVVNSGDAEAAAVFSGAGLVRRSSAFGLSVPAVGGGESVGDPKLLPLVTVTVGSTVPTVSPFAFVYDVLSGDDGTIPPSPGPFALLIFNGIIFANPGESGDRGDPPTFDCALCVKDCNESPEPLAGTGGGNTLSEPLENFDTVETEKRDILDAIENREYRYWS